MSTPSTSLRLDGAVGLVTGAASGIGARVAVGLAEAGAAAVGCLDRPGSDLSVVVAAVNGAGARAVALTADVTDADAVDRAVTEVTLAFGPLTVAINAAGIAHAAPAEELPVERFRHVVDVNLTGVFLSCRAEGRSMLAAGGGAIVNIASMSGTIVNRGLTQVHYNASKAAVTQLSRSLAMEWAPRGVRVNALSPGYTATPMNARPEVADRAARFATDTPLGRMAAVDELVGPTVFLLSPGASFVTGIDLLVDGGFTCW